MSRHLPAIATAALLAAGLGASAQTNAPAKPAAPEGVLVRLGKEGEAIREVILVKREGPEIYFRMTNSPPGVMSSFKVEAFDDAEFKVVVPEEKAYAASTQRRWAQAAALLHGALAPTFPFLDLRENNATEPVMAAARYYLRAAQQAFKRGEAGRPEAEKWYGYAHALFTAAGRSANWHPYGESSVIRAQMCLIEIGRLDEAAKGLAAAREPAPGDASYGIFWLAKARLLYAQEKPRDALDAAVQSVIHENKDVETFPDALMLAAQCYEDVNEPHRARDVYYEVARLFTGTDWGDEARLRLKFIMENGMTASGEDPNIAGIFFGTEEDMNALANKYLKESEPKAAPDATPAGAQGEKP